MQGACDLLRKTMEQADFQPTPESVEQAANYYVATQALAELAVDPRTARFELGATVSGGTLRLVGPYLPEADLRLVRSVAEPVPGISEVDYEPGYTPAFLYASTK